MIQRVQTLFLLGASILLILILFFPIWSAEGANLKAIADAYSVKVLNENSQVVKEESTVYIAALAILSAITAFFAIFQYKNRGLQVRLGLLNILLISGIIGCYFIAISNGQEAIPMEEESSFKISFFLPLIALLFTLLANRFIKKDEKLVRSADRLR